MRRIATVLAAGAMTGVLVTPTPAAAAETPLPDLAQSVCQAQKPALPPKASVLVGPVLDQTPALPQQTPKAMQSPIGC